MRATLAVLVAALVGIMVAPGAASAADRDGTCDSGDQVYRPSSALASTSSAVDRTWSTRMTRNGNILRAHYCATTTACGGWVDGDWLSQYGSRDLANAGRNYQAILRHYYSDVAIS